MYIKPSHCHVYINNFVLYIYFDMVKMVQVSSRITRKESNNTKCAEIIHKSNCIKCNKNAIEGFFTVKWLKIIINLFLIKFKVNFSISWPITIYFYNLSKREKIRVQFDDSSSEIKIFRDSWQLKASCHIRFCPIFGKEWVKRKICNVTKPK